MRDYPISKISIKMLCETADINRSTFYSHYTDQYQLLMQLEEDVIIELKKYIMKDSIQTVQSMSQILDYIAQNTDLFKVLLSENGDSTFQKEIMHIAQEKMISDINNNPDIDERTSEYLQYFAVAGALSIVQKWLQDGIPESSEKMSELTSKLLYHGIAGFYS
ncbi:MAG: TetR family transcriptional regulator C-terminal domain-containing protein, partial [Acetobacterium sp.]|nr:TetR family transcriptional regulator C-terminal domain-containing protein [Bacillota bacterium]MCG2731444.1 TetR family transcriptional regulator C-terminal domain-containing protein [Acetobacterium sp.]